jgi:single-strand DNA-binding protein
MNKVFLSGNLTRDPEVRYTQTGKAYAKMGIAVRRQFNKDKDAVDFFNIVAFDKTAEFCGRYLVKGSRVLVEGRLQTSSYEAQDGSKRTSTEIMVDNIEFAGARPGGSDGGNYSGNRPADDYSSNRQTNDFYGDSGRNSAPSKKNDDYFGGGEPIDPDDTPF